jgi:hypothetical protein
MFESKKIVPLQVSKWVKVPVLVDVSEMKQLLNELPSFKIYDVQRITEPDEGIYEPAFFLEKYEHYIAYLKRGEVPPTNEFRAIFSAAWSVTEKAIYALPAQEGRRLLKVSQPSVQTQLNQIRYSQQDKTFRTQVYSNDSISWGIQLGFPHLFLDPTTHEASSTREFANMPLFLTIQRWIRLATLPTPFLVQGERINAPIRLGKECFAWIHTHPQLIANGIEISKRA